MADLVEVPTAEDLDPDDEGEAFDGSPRSGSGRDGMRVIQRRPTVSPDTSTGTVLVVSRAGRGAVLGRRGLTARWRARRTAARSTA